MVCHGRRRCLCALMECPARWLVPHLAQRASRNDRSGKRKSRSRSPCRTYKKQAPQRRGRSRLSRKVQFGLRSEVRQGHHHGKIKSNDRRILARSRFSGLKNTECQDLSAFHPAIEMARTGLTTRSVQLRTDVRTRTLGGRSPT